ncbi:hypothetical protein ABH920_004847 [Catenulispora sp. EB89]|uniref:barstar family protein n=1 Tax=Catenulispora sp. EB89 TaxID=3156257 RepID=UPI003515F003
MIARFDPQWTVWERDLPLRYLVAWENEDGEPELWAKAVGVEGLFADPVPLRREVLTLRGCEPTDALDIAAADAAHEAFGLFSEWGRPLGRCRRVDGLYRARPGPAKTPVTLVGCEPAGLLRTLRRPRSWDTAVAELLVLDRAGRAMTRRRVSLAIDRVRPSVLKAALVDVTFADCFDPPPTAARSVWQAWYEGVPVEPNQWARFSTPGRDEWLDLTFPARTKAQTDTTGGTYHLDGRFVTDMPGLHCAMAEALVGPGGYFGREWMAFKDCLAGSFGVAPPFTLVWQDADVARHALADAYGDPGERHNYFDEIVALLRGYGATVVLQ